MIALLSLAWALEWRADVGADLQTTPHGYLTLAARQGAWSGGLYTDTLELRWAPEGERGRGWVAARGEAGASGLMITPWTGGAPDPERAVLAHTLGGEAGALRYLPGGFYAGAVGSSSTWLFADTDTTTAPLPENRKVLRADLVTGLWRPEVQAWALVGAQRALQTTSPHAHLRLHARPLWRLAPELSLAAGVARNQDDVTRTRLGGLNPHVVPLAGAAWAEFWVEDYAAAQVGASWDGERVAYALYTDLVRFDGWQTAALGGRFRFERELLSAEVHGGWAPWLPRQEGLRPVSAWVLLSRAWG